MEVAPFSFFSLSLSSSPPPPLFLSPVVSSFNERRLTVRFSSPSWRIMFYSRLRDFSIDALAFVRRLLCHNDGCSCTSRECYLLDRDASRRPIKRRYTPIDNVLFPYAAPMTSGVSEVTGVSRDYYHSPLFLGEMRLSTHCCPQRNWIRPRGETNIHERATLQRKFCSARSPRMHLSG